MGRQHADGRAAVGQFGTRGEALQNGAKELKIFGEFVPVRAEVVELTSMSAHGDYLELIEWLGSVKEKPKRVFLTHGEPAAADAFRKHIERRLAWQAEIPEHKQTVRLK